MGNPCRAQDDIKTYTVPKESNASDPAAVTVANGSPAGSPSDIPVGTDHLTWTTPSTWQELPPTSIRLGNFIVKGSGDAKAEVAIFSFPGSVGTELENVNRWRNELKLPPISANQVESAPVTVDSFEGKLYEIPGASTETVAVSLPRNGSTWFFKMKGDKDVVADAEPVFRDFLKTVRFNSASPTAPHDASLDGAAAVHGDTAGGSGADKGAEPEFAVPANWKPGQAGPMIFKAYEATTDAGKSATVTISFFPGDVGGLFANVNRWRRQMSLPPVEENDLGGVTKPMTTRGGPATTVDFSGTNAKTGQPGRLVAVVVPHGDNTWFYKLTGDDQAVGAEKERFLKFVQTVQYP